MATFTISGSVGAAGAGATIKLSGAASATTTAAAVTGNYSFSGLANGSYLVTPGLVGSAFSPSNSAAVVNSANITGLNFLTLIPGHRVSTFASNQKYGTRVESPKTDIDSTNFKTGTGK